MKHSCHIEDKYQQNAKIMFTWSTLIIVIQLSGAVGPTLPKKRLSSICNNSNAAECISTRGQPVISSVTFLNENISNQGKNVYLHEKFLIILRIKLQKCALTSRILILSLSVSDIKYCIAPSIYSTNVGCNDIVSRSKTQVLQTSWLIMPSALTAASRTSATSQRSNGTTSLYKACGEAEPKADLSLRSAFKLSGEEL
uniref:Uncharacterized protein n=1 Tax=Glossina austeni TaxID=7395 RepID=A0A1A9UFY8_GLOAU